MRQVILLMLLVLGAVGVGCDKSDSAKEVVLYTSVDAPTARPIIAEFEKRTGIKVTLKTDTEATKSVGLAELIRAEKDSPRGDVWWSNEVFLTINLADEGLLAPYTSDATMMVANEMSKQFVDEEHRWYCNGLRARMLVTNEKHAPLKSIEELTDVSLKGQILMARPTAGTTGGHVAAMYVLWGEASANRYFKMLHDNGVKLVGGNSVVADSVGNGAAVAGLTDNDDASAAEREGGKLKAVLPDQESFGTLLIPTSVAMVKGAKHTESAGKLIDYLASREVEKMLIDGKFAGWSIREDGLQDSKRPKGMNVDYRAVAKGMEKAVSQVTGILEGR